jgi:MFS family permease
MAGSDTEPDPTLLSEDTPLLRHDEAASNNESQTVSAARSAAAFGIALACCGCANSISLFSMFAPGFKHKLGYSLLEINDISIAASLGMYLPVPILGYIADRLGPGILAILSIFLFTPAYYIASVIVSTESLETSLLNYRLLTTAFVFIGTATSALYFSCVITCARVYSKSPGLSISAPVAFYGLSSLWQSQLLQWLFRDDEGELILSKSFYFFAILYTLTGLLSFASTRVGGVIGSVKTQEAKRKARSGGTDNENDEEEDVGEEVELGTIAESVGDMIYKRHETVGQFLCDHTAWMLFMAFVLSSGPLEMFLNNMGIIIDTIPHGPPVSTHVSFFSAFSTVARLGVGVVSDFVKEKVSRPMMLSIVLFLTAIIHFILAAGLFTELDNGRYFFIPSSTNGFSYGSVYTLIPTIIACTWGIENLGTHWGLFIIGPAIGTSGFGVLFAKVYDAASKSISGLVENGFVSAVVARTCTGKNCYKLTFLITGISIFVSGLLISTVWVFAWKPSR